MLEPHAINPTRAPRISSRRGPRSAAVEAAQAGSAASLQASNIRADAISIASSVTWTSASTCARRRGEAVRQRAGRAETARDRVDAVEPFRPAEGETAMHRIGAERFDAENAAGRLEQLDGACHPRDQPTAADGNDQRVQTRRLLGEFRAACRRAERHERTLDGWISTRSSAAHIASTRSIADAMSSVRTTSAPGARHPSIRIGSTWRGITTFAATPSHPAAYATARA